MTSLLKQYIPEIAAVLIIAVLSLLLWTQTNRLNAVQNEYDQYILSQQKGNQEISKEAGKVAQENYDYNKIVIAELQNELNKTQEQLTSTQSQLASSSSANRGLRNELARLRDANDTSTPGNCTAAINAAILSTDLQRECETRVVEVATRLVEVAAVADRSHVAGSACVRSYTSISEVLNSAK